MGQSVLLFTNMRVISKNCWPKHKTSQGKQMKKSMLTETGVLWSFNIGDKVLFELHKFGRKSRTRHVIVSWFWSMTARSNVWRRLVKYCTVLIYRNASKFTQVSMWLFWSRSMKRLMIQQEQRPNEFFLWCTSNLRRLERILDHRMLSKRTKLLVNRKGKSTCYATCERGISGAVQGSNSGLAGFCLVEGDELINWGSMVAPWLDCSDVARLW